MNRIAGDFVVFVDDTRVTGFYLENCWQCVRRLSSNIQYSEMQEVARNCVPPSLDADNWAGCVIKTNACVKITITQAK